MSKDNLDDIVEICDGLIIPGNTVDIHPQYYNETDISEDGITEAIERDNILGVQWHPEKIDDLEFFRKFFGV